jgi:Leucine-rich repeat (LRR) protein
MNKKTEDLALDAVITNVLDLGKGYVYRHGFVFNAIDEPANVYDGIVLRNPSTCNCWSPKLPFSPHSLEDHIEFINRYNIEKALIIAEDLSFITACPTLKYLRIMPADTASQGFDYSPLYDMPEIRSLDCYTRYGGYNEHLSTTIDASQIRGLRTLYVRGEGCLNFDKIETLETLSISNYNKLEHLRGLSQSKGLKKLNFVSCNFKSLDGIENLPNLQTLRISYNRKLSNISALEGVRESLTRLTFGACPKITDFSVLSSLSGLEALTLEGSNSLPSVEFLNNMKNLWFFINTMIIENGDLTPCLSIPYVDIKGRKHYNYKNKDLPKKRK